MLVKDIMTQKVVAIDPEMPIGDAHALMEQRNIRHFPIVEVSSPTGDDSSRPKDDTSRPKDDSSRPKDDSSRPKDDTSRPKDDTSRLVGIISDRDIRSVGSELPKAKRGVTLKDPVRQIMTSPVLTAHPLDPVEESARVLREHKIGAMPVLEDGELVGIVTGTDFLAALVTMTGVYEAASRLEVEVENRPGALAKLAKAISARGFNISSVLTTHRDGETIAFVLRVDTIDGRGLAGALREEGFSVVWPPEK